MRINLACEATTVKLILFFRTVVKGGAAACTVIAMQDGGTGTRARSMAAQAARPTSFLSCHRTSMRAPRVGGTFQFQIFIQTPSPEIWSETISGREEGAGGKWGGLFLGYLLGKNIGGVIALISYRLTWDGCSSLLPSEVCYPFGRKHGRR
jgi:hypothetical protein